MLGGTSLRSLVDQAQRLRAAGQHGPALTLCRQALKQNASDLGALRVMAAAQVGLGEYADARRTIDKALKLKPADLELLHELARSWMREGRLEEAKRAAVRALRVAPDNAVLAALKARIQTLAGEHDAAWDVLRGPAEAGVVEPALAASLAEVARRVGQEERAIDLLRRCADLPGLPPLARADQLFRLGALLDARGDYDPAWSAFAEANAIRRSLLRYDVDYTAAQIDELIGKWSRAAARAFPRVQARADRCLFIVGVPRSGTSLVEQIFGSHPRVFAAGELNDIPRTAHEWQGTMGGNVAVFTRTEELAADRLGAASRAYLDHLRRLSRAADRVTDKMPLNLLHLGLVSLMLPGARVIRCARDPLDTCLSCYFQNFSGNNPFAYDLRDLGVFHRACDRLAAHWRAALDLPIMDVPYEELVADQEGVSRRMVEFAGLPWDDRCLRFYESGRAVLTASNDQVRRPVYASSVGRWRPYEKHLGPLLAALGL